MIRKKERISKRQTYLLFYTTLNFDSFSEPFFQTMNRLTNWKINVTSWDAEIFCFNVGKFKLHVYYYLNCYVYFGCCYIQYHAETFLTSEVVDAVRGQKLHISTLTLALSLNVRFIPQRQFCLLTKNLYSYKNIKEYLTIMQS